MPQKALSKHQKRQRHHHHAADNTPDNAVPVTVFVRGRQQFVQRNVHHDAGHESKHHAESRFAEYAAENDISQYGAQRLGQARKGAVPKRFAFAARGVVNGQRHGYALGHVVYGHGHRNGHAQRDIFHRRHKGGQPFGEIMHGQSQRRKKPQMFEFVFLLDH